MTGLDVAELRRLVAEEASETTKLEVRVRARLELARRAGEMLAEIERLRADFLAGWNAAIEKAAEIAHEYAKEAEHQRDTATDYPDSRQGAQVHGYMHGALDVEIRIRRILNSDKEAH